MEGAGPDRGGPRGRVPPPEDDGARPADLPRIGTWPPRGRWPDAVLRAVAAVREVLAEAEAEAGDGADAAAATARRGDAPAGSRGVTALVALSGGADSLALAITCAVLRGTRGGASLGGVGAVVVDHGLQEGSAAVADAAARMARRMGLAPVILRRVDVARTGDGPEAEARAARREAFAQAALDAGAGLVLTAHTADDQAEQVLLGIARGSGTRSLAGIPTRGELPGGVALARPFLGLTRQDTEAICRWADALWWTDPHNADDALLRSRVRGRVLPALEDAESGLGPGVRAALVRTAAIAAEDAAALDAWAGRAFVEVRVADGAEVQLALPALAALPAAVRRRVISLAAVAAGGGRPSRERVLAVDALVVPARPGSGGSAGPVQLPGGVEARRIPARGRASEAGADVVGDGGACARLELGRRRPRT